MLRVAGTSPWQWTPGLSPNVPITSTSAVKGLCTPLARVPAHLQDKSCDGIAGPKGACLCNSLKITKSPFLGAGFTHAALACMRASVSHQHVRKAFALFFVLRSGEPVRDLLALHATSSYPVSTTTTPGHTLPAWAHPVARQVHPGWGSAGTRQHFSEAPSSKEPSRIAPRAYMLSSHLPLCIQLFLILISPCNLFPISFHHLTLSSLRAVGVCPLCGAQLGPMVGSVWLRPSGI